MSVARLIIQKLLDAVDIAFDAGVTILRVLLRARFQPDAKSYGGSRFLDLGGDKLLVQEVALNASDQTQARRAIALDPDRYLPLSLDAALFDIAGPIDNGAVRDRPERTFVLAVARKDALEEARTEVPLGRARTLEGFVYRPPQVPQVAFAFIDGPAHARRRHRRAALAAALLAFAFAANEAWTSWQEALDRAVVAADTERAQAERELRLAQRRLAEAEATASAATSPAPRLPVVTEALATLAQHQLPQSEFTEVGANPTELRIVGRSHVIAATELELRRGFEGARISFSTAAGEDPQPFEARLVWKVAEPPQ